MLHSCLSSECLKTFLPCIRADLHCKVHWMPVPVRKHWKFPVPKRKSCKYALIDSIHIWVTPHHHQDITFLYKEFKKVYFQPITSNQGFFDGIWLGATDLAKRGTFAWKSTGENLKYFNWLAGQPDNLKGNERCVQMVSGVKGKWNDNNCGENSQVTMCEKLWKWNNVRISRSKGL